MNSLTALDDTQIELARKGDKKAIEQLIQVVQKPVFNLAVRFLWKRMDAEDATQDILIKVISNLGTFRGQSQFKTWVYRLASNHLLNIKRTESENLSFEDGEYYLNLGMTYPAYEGADKQLLEEEVKIACSTSMLICLSRPLRMAYLVGEILEFDGNDGAHILEILPATFRRRLADARKLIRSFMARQCGLYNPKNSCRCASQINYCIDVDWFKPGQLQFADKGDTAQAKREIETILDEVAIFQSHPEYRAPASLLDKVKLRLTSGDFPKMTEVKKD